jgi:hypothetical protein
MSTAEAPADYYLLGFEIKKNKIIQKSNINDFEFKNIIILDPAPTATLGDSNIAIPKENRYCLKFDGIFTKTVDFIEGCDHDPPYYLLYKHNDTENEQLLGLYDKGGKLIQITPSTGATEIIMEDVVTHLNTIETTENPNAKLYSAALSLLNIGEAFMNKPAIQPQPQMDSTGVSPSTSSVVSVPQTILSPNTELYSAALSLLNIGEAFVNKTAIQPVSPSVETIPTNGDVSSITGNESVPPAVSSNAEIQSAALASSTIVASYAS